MAEVNIAYAATGSNANSAQKTNTTSGTLKSESKERTVFPYQDTESVTQGTSAFIEQANQQPEPPPLTNHEITYFPAEEIALQDEVSHLMQELSEPPQKLTTQSNPLTHSQVRPDGLPKETKQEAPRSSEHSLPNNGQAPRQNVIHKSLFSLARSFNETLQASKGNKERAPSSEKESHHAISRHLPLDESPSQENHFHERGQEKGSDRERQDDGSHQEKEQRENKESFLQEQQKERSKNKISLSVNKTGLSTEQHKNPQKTHASASKVKTKHKHHSPRMHTPPSQVHQAKKKGAYGIDNIFVRFMALMARILGQAEAEAHTLYLRIKERTDQIDTLIELLSKINSEKGAIDWSKDEEMKELLNKARSLGVDISEGKYKWSEEEKKMLKENIQMRKDSMEKVTQLERTDMQRYLQEASQCHQARSNILKLLKEVNDTIIHNMRPN